MHILSLGGPGRANPSPDRPVSPLSTIKLDLTFHSTSWSSPVFQGPPGTLQSGSASFKINFADSRPSLEFLFHCGIIPLLMARASLNPT